MEESVAESFPRHGLVALNRITFSAGSGQGSAIGAGRLGRRRFSGDSNYSVNVVTDPKRSVVDAERDIEELVF